ncbi:hypothetical protein BC826DRAFT_464934 [Russula brevipes]|nr:hypothetical protein BC826DRAFT_464934 [Russula brevipes]
MCPLYAASQSGEFGQYFEHPGDLIADGESRKTTRQAGLPEVAHITHIATCEWQRLWEGGHNRRPGDNKLPLNEHLMHMIFFAALGGTVKNGVDDALRNESWPFYVILKREGCQGDEELRKFRPRSDFRVSNSVLPRLLVEVNSILTSQVPPDLIRMLITGAFIVRFANKFLGAFKEAKDFVLCAIFVWDDGDASRYTLFQHSQHNQVYYHTKDFSLNVPSHRVEFARILYNLLGEDISEEQNKDMKHVMAQLKKEVEARGLKSMHTEDPKNNNSMDNDDDAGRGGGGGGHAQLGAHGYEVKSDVIVDDKGIEWELMSEVPVNPFLPVVRYADARP